MNHSKPNWLNSSKKIKDHSSLNFLNLTTSSVNLSGYYPFFLDIIPHSISSPNIYSIKYFVDGEEIVNHKFFPAQMSSENLSIENLPAIPYPLTPGDPRNYLFSYVFNSSAGSNKIHQVSSLIYVKGSPLPIIHSFNISLSSPQTLYGSNSAGFFEDITLVKHYMFGPNNDIVYFLESKSPNYLLPVLVNWNN